MLKGRETGLARTAKLTLSASRASTLLRSQPDDTDNGSQHETHKNHQSSCAKTQLTAHRARSHRPNRNHRKGEAHSDGRSSTNQRSDECDCSRHRMSARYLVPLFFGLIAILGKCFRMELVVTYRPCRARPTVGHGYTTVRFYAKTPVSIHNELGLLS